MKIDSLAVWRNKDYRNFLLIRLCITLATQIQAVIVGWQIYELTKDPLSLGLIGLAEAIPALSVALYAGHLTDITSRKKILMISYLILFISSSSLFIVSGDFISSIAALKIPSIYSMIFIGGLARGFLFPATFAFTAQLVPREQYALAVTWNTTVWQIGAISGPALAGFLYAFFGATNSYLTVVTLIMLAIIFLLFIKGRPVPELTTEQNLFGKLTAGLKFVFSNKMILSAISLDLFAVLFGGAVALLPIFAGQILMTGPQGLGILRAAPSVGAVIMALIMTRKSPVTNAGRNLFIGVTGFGFCMIAFALSGNFYVSVFFLALSGAFDSLSVVIRSTIMQVMTPENMKGRVSAVNSIFIGSSNEIGAFESGVAAKILGTVPSVIFGGIMTLIVVSVTMLSYPPLRKLSMK